MWRICGIFVWTCSLCISQAIAFNLAAVIMPSLAAIFNPNIPVDKGINHGVATNALTNFFLVTVNDGERYSCSMSSGISFSAASPNRKSFGNLENLNRLSQETKSNHWQEVKFQVFRTDHILFWHAGLKITFHNKENSSAYALDWGMDNTADCLFCNKEITGRLTLYSLMEHEIKMYEDCNKIIDGVTIPIESEVSRSKLHTIMLEIREFPMHHTYAPLNENTALRAMNCRGLCWWVLEKLDKAEFEGVNDNDSGTKHDTEGKSWLNRFLAVAAGGGSS